MEINEILQIVNHKTILFRGIEKNEIQDMLNSVPLTLKTFTKNQVIATEMSECHSVGIVLKGIVEVKKLYSNGKVVTLTRLQEGNIFGEVIIFSDMDRYPAHILSVEDSEILFIHRSDIEKLCHEHKHFMTNVLRLLSNRIRMLNRKITFLSYQTIRQKVAYYLLQEFNKHKKNLFSLTVSRKDMAELLGVPRPSLSREFMKLKEEGIIDYESKAIKILNLQGLEDCLF